MRKEGYKLAMVDPKELKEMKSGFSLFLISKAHLLLIIHKILYEKKKTINRFKMPRSVLLCC